MRKVLIVEDDPALRLLYELMFKKSFQSAIVNICSDGEEALVMLQEERSFDLIITDMLMPNMDGSIFIRALANDTQTKNIPVLVCSSLDQNKIDVLKKLPENVKSYLRKPIKPKEFEQVISGILTTK